MWLLILVRRLGGGGEPVAGLGLIALAQIAVQAGDSSRAEGGRQWTSF